MGKAQRNMIKALKSRDENNTILPQALCSVRHVYTVLLYEASLGRSMSTSTVYSVELMGKTNHGDVHVICEVLKHKAHGSCGRCYIPRSVSYSHVASSTGPPSFVHQGVHATGRIAACEFICGAHSM